MLLIGIRNEESVWRRKRRREVLEEEAEKKTEKTIGEKKQERGSDGTDHCGA